MTGLPIWRHLITISFCTDGTSSSGIWAPAEAENGAEHVFTNHDTELGCRAEASRVANHAVSGAKPF